MALIATSIKHVIVNFNPSISLLHLRLPAFVRLHCCGRASVRTTADHDAVRDVGWRFGGGTRCDGRPELSAHHGFTRDGFDGIELGVAMCRRVCVSRGGLEGESRRFECYWTNNACLHHRRVIRVAPQGRRVETALTERQASHAQGGR